MMLMATQRMAGSNLIITIYVKLDVYASVFDGRNEWKMHGPLVDVEYCDVLRQCQHGFYYEY